MSLYQCECQNLRQQHHHCCVCRKKESFSSHIYVDVVSPPLQPLCFRDTLICLSCGNQAYSSYLKNIILKKESKINYPSEVRQDKEVSTFKTALLILLFVWRSSQNELNQSKGLEKDCKQPSVAFISQHQKFHVRN